ncbi:MAG TPA: hypothetical protein VM146_00460 [Steroidobacteraceae bacterium]|nr:hypothetical protein [Steroidobacteraceae bacterium]
MSKGVVVSVVAAAAVFGGVWYFAARSDAPEPTQSGAHGVAQSGAQPVAEDRAAGPARAGATPADIGPTDSKGRPVPADPRLLALMVTPDDALIDYVKGPDGRVIRELDNDPNSPRYRKPVREYIYAGANVAGLTTYRNVGGQVEVVRVLVSYKPDGGIDQYRESVAHQPN